MAAIRFISVHNDEIHYHANFAVYINGVKDEFKSPLYYEEVQSCSAAKSDDPKGRVHMHNQESSVVHVHDTAATWGHFLANLGYGVTDDALKTDQGLYTDQTENKLTYILNGEVADSVANRVIKDKDVLLINYGSEDRTAMNGRFDLIPRDAHKYNDTVDPAGCSGSEPITIKTRLKKAFGIE